MVFVDRPVISFADDPATSRYPPRRRRERRVRPPAPQSPATTIREAPLQRPGRAIETEKRQAAPVAEQRATQQNQARQAQATQATQQRAAQQNQARQAQAA